MRTIRSQILASTSLDLHNEKLTEDQLRKLFEDTPSETVVNQNHDMSKSVVGRIYNKQLVRLESGELAIAADIDILDEDAYTAAGGFSISYLRRHFSVNSDRKAEIEILFNPQVFNIQEFQPLIQLSTKDFQIDAIELVQKGLVTFALLILGFVGLQVASGFFRQIGSDAYSATKTWLRNFAERKKSERNQEIVFQVQFTTKLNEVSVLIIIQFSVANFPIIESGGISVEAAIEQLSLLIGSRQIQRATITVKDTLPYWEITSFTDTTGKTTQF